MLGAVPIGMLSAALLVAAGASEVLVSEPSQTRRERVRQVGAVPVSPESISEEEAEVVFECVGRVETMQAAVGAAKPGGTVMWVGVAPPEAEVPVKPYEVFRRELTIRGTYTNPYVMERALAILASGKINWETIVAHRFPISQFDDAWGVHSGGEGLKVCIYPDE